MELQLLNEELRKDAERNDSDLVWAISQHYLEETEENYENLSA
jgi:hypothetical protein